MHLRNCTVESIIKSKYLKSAVMFANLWKIHPQRTYNLYYMRRYVVAYPVYGSISILSKFIVLTRGNVTLNIAIGPFVRMTLQSRPSCGENRPVFDEIGLVVGIGPDVGIGLFGGTGLVVSLTYIA